MNTIEEQTIEEQTNVLRKKYLLFKNILNQKIKQIPFRITTLNLFDHKFEIHESPSTEELNAFEIKRNILLPLDYRYFIENFSKDIDTKLIITDSRYICGCVHGKLLRMPEIMVAPNKKKCVKIASNSYIGDLVLFVQGDMYGKVAETSLDGEIFIIADSFLEYMKSWLEDSEEIKILQGL